MNFYLYKDYLDLTHLKTYTIDDIGAHEIDDAISYEYISSNHIFWIHIACPAISVDINSKIAKDALAKASTIYMLEKTEYMFPPLLIKNNLSLLSGNNRIVLSLKIELDEKFIIRKYSFHKAIISPRYSLSYEDADEILDLQPREESELLAIERITKQHSLERHNNGAITISEPEGYISKIKAEYILCQRSRTASRKLVSESMIIYGEFVAKYCIDRNIPVPYRNQSKPVKSRITQVMESSNVHIKNFQLRNSLPKTTIDMKVKGHNSLGLEGYVQATSPLRRYLDYLTQCQLIKYINNEDLLDVEFIASRIKSFNKKQRENIIIFRDDRRRSLLNWFKLNNQIYWTVLFMQWLNKKKSIALIYFCDLRVDMSCQLDFVEGAELGDKFKISIEFINTELDILRTKLYC